MIDTPTNRVGGYNLLLFRSIRNKWQGDIVNAQAYLNENEEAHDERKVQEYLKKEDEQNHTFSSLKDGLRWLHAETIKALQSIRAQNKKQNNGDVSLKKLICRLCDTQELLYPDVPKDNQLVLDVLSALNKAGIKTGYTGTAKDVDKLRKAIKNALSYREANDGDLHKTIKRFHDLEKSG